MKNELTGGKLARVVKNTRYYEGTIVVVIDFVQTHPKYKKIIRRHTRLQVMYNQKTPIECNQMVYIKPCKPVSKTKRWEVVGVKEC